MGTNERGRFFSWPWDWQDWRLPQPLLYRMGMLDTGYQHLSDPKGAEPDPHVEEEEENSLAPADLASLVEIADELSVLIQPARPDPVFRARLKLALISAYEENSPRRVPFLTKPDTLLPPWQVMATVPVLVGVAALLWRYRPRPETQPGKAA